MRSGHKYTKVILSIGIISILTFIITTISNLSNSHTPNKCIPPTEFNFTLEVLQKRTNLMNIKEKQTCQTICKDLKKIIPQNRRRRSRRAPKKTSLIISHHLIGGSWMFKDNNSGKSVDSEDLCNSSPKSGVAILFVCNNRWKQLNTILPNLISILQKQHLCYRIFVIEQEETTLINKAMLMNIGFIEAMKLFHFACIVFHDTDLNPLNDRIPYGCDEQTALTPVHLGVALDTRNFTLLYDTLIGGVLKISVEHFLTVNGYSNSYWGWGQEDDDMEIRLKTANIQYIHADESIARYQAIPHSQQSQSMVSEHVKLLKTAVCRMPYDGLTSLNYHIRSIKYKAYFTHILVSIGSYTG
ncbi:unnamed protein product [Trichobilharzia szidati]|nr:unnamed protein product [Trichobilharzia szidati]